MDVASSGPQTLTEILMDTQTEIKDLVKDAMFNVLVMMTFPQRLKKLLDKNLAEIEDEELRAKYRPSLEKFALAEYRTMINLLNLGTFPIILSFSAYNIDVVNTRELQRRLDVSLRTLDKSNVNKAFSQLGNSQAKVSFGQSVYNSSEMVMRAGEQREMVDRLSRETRLVVCDTHSDCSDRCFPWQGRVYSLDHTSGKTDDGREYVPLEVATDVYVTSKSGKTWRNGLLGFNCRHKLVPYEKGLKPNKVSRAEQQTQKRLTEQQRLYEREIRNAKDRARAFALGQQNERQFDRSTREYMQEKAELYRDKARELTKKYQEFCHANNRVEYRSRLKI